MSSKTEIRSKILEKRAALSEAIQHQHSTRIIQRLQEVWGNPHSIAAYVSARGEVQAELLFPHLKKLYLPCLAENSSLQFREYEFQDELIKNKFGILEPSPEKNLISPEKLDCVIVPVVAFTDRCARLGMGKGFYDRTFALIAPTLIGLAYEFQRVDQIPQEPWDLSMDMIITEERTYKCP